MEAETSVSRNASAGERFEGLEVPLL
jgi:hypothetical protein